ncbi:MAG: hypothetical protein MJY48_04045 [Bacteroidales bacterium]|nr:hypothetical protein [Bacteroidales bacterium]
MKNVLKSFAAFIFAALAISSCANSELVPETPKGPTHTVKFTSGVPETKTDMDINPESKAVTYTWTDEDLNRLTVYENGVEGTIDTENSSISAASLVIYATFEGEPTDDAKEYTAVLNGVVGNQTPRVDENSYDEEADVLVAKPITATAAEGIEFQFRRAVAVNKMNLLDLPVGETLSTVKITSDKPISGKIVGNDWSEESLGYSIELTVNEEIPANGKLTLYYMAIPVEGAILTVDAKIGTDSYLKKFDKTLTTEAGNVKGYSVGLKKQASIKITENFNSDETTSLKYGGAALSEKIASKWDHTWTFGGKVYANQNSLRFGSSSATGYVQSSTILNNIPAGVEFTVKVYAAIWNGDDAAKLLVTYNDDENSETPANPEVKNSNDADYDASHFTNANTFTFTKVADKNEFKIGNNAGRLMVDKVEISYEGDAPSAINANDISDVPAAGVNGATFNFSVVNIIGTPTATPDGDIVTAASVNGNTVTYTVSENTSYKARQGTITITIGSDQKEVKVNQNGVIPSYTGAGTIDSPYTVADALLKIETLDADAESDEVYVTGPIKEIKSFSEKYGSIEYVIGDDTKSLLIYGGLDFGGKTFSSVGDIAVEQKVVVKGKLTLYESTKEMKSNNQLVKVNGYDYVLKSIEVTGAKTVFDEGNDFSKGNAVVTASYRGNKENTNVTEAAEFTGYASTVGPHKITVSYTENYITKTTTYDVTVASSTEYGINVSKTGTGNGTVSFTVNGESNVTETKAGATVVVTVTPELKNHVEAFSVTGLTGTQALEDGQYEFTMPESAVTINVQFEPNPTAADGTILWSESWGDNEKTVFGDAEVEYTYTDGGSETKLYDAALAGGTAPELLISKNNGALTVSGIPTGNATKFTLTYKSNNPQNLSVSVDGATSVSKSEEDKDTEWIIIVPDNTDSFEIVITNTESGNARIDDFELVVGAPKSAQAISFTEKSKTITLGEDYEIGETYYDIQRASLTVGNGEISYSVTDGTDVVEVNAAGHVKIKKIGTATITATAAETPEYKEASASYTLTIKEAGGGTSNPRYVKVTEDSQISAGRYLIVFGTSAHATMNSKDLVATVDNLTVSNNTIAYTAAIAAAEVVFETKSGETGYSIKLPAGTYLSCNANSNQAAGLQSPFYFDNISASNGISGTDSANNKRYLYQNGSYIRFYKSNSNYTTATLYKYTE